MNLPAISAQYLPVRNLRALPGHQPCMAEALGQGSGPHRGRVCIDLPNPTVSTVGVPQDPKRRIGGPMPEIMAGSDI